MATKAKSTKSTKSTPAVLDETIEPTEETQAEATAKQVINEGITRVMEATGVDVQKGRYKAMRAIAFQAFSNAIADGTFDDLVDEAIANVDELPAGWEIERAEKAEETKSVKTAKSAKAPGKKAAAATAPAKSARKRPTR